MMAELQGLREISLKLKRLPKNIRNRHVGKALRAGAKIVRDDARRAAPEAPVKIGGKYPVIPGIVKKNIVVRTSTGRRAGANADVKVRIGVNVDRTGRTTGTDAFYWRFHEFGTAKLAARPFLRPAFEGNKAPILAAITRQMKTAIKKEGRRR